MENLTPPQLAYIRRLWRNHRDGTMIRAFKRAMTIAAVITLTAIVLSFVAASNDASPIMIWVLGFAFGAFYTVGAMSFRAKRVWPGIDAIIDWKRVEEIATADEKPI
jgi:1,4-dihydroxy-2-naphthoate octaprenyltransferase